MRNYVNIDEIASAGKFSSSIFETIYMTIRHEKKKFFVFIFIGFLGRACLLINANIVGIWADKICNNPAICNIDDNFFSNYSFAQFTILMLFLASMGFVFTVLFRLNVSKIGTNASALFYDETTYRVSRFPISFFDTTPFGRIITRFSSDYAAITRMSGGPLSEVLSILFDLILFCLLILLASYYFLPIIFIIIFFNYILYKKNKLTIRKERRQLGINRAPTISHFSETIQGLKDIRIYGKEKIFKYKFHEKLKDFIMQKIKTNNLMNLFSLKMAILNISILFITGVIGAFLMLHQYITLGSLIVVLTFILMTSSTIQVFFEWLTAIEEALTGIERMDYYLKMELEKGSTLPQEAKFNVSYHKSNNYSLKQKVSALAELKNASLEVTNLSIRYYEQSPIILKNISFQINPGEKVGIIGKTGSGKSSLIQAIYYLYPFYEGCIRINGYEPAIGQNIENDKIVSLNDYRSALSIISQEPILFSGTLRDNLILDKNISDEEIFEIAKRLGLRKVLLGGKKLLDAEIKENGRNFSLGERQLLCMTRCLLQNRPVVLMDEATSSIDPCSEEILVNAANQYLQGKTQIIVAHQLSTIESCDRILWIDSGKLVMNGSPKSVLSKFKDFEESKMN